MYISKWEKILNKIEKELLENGWKVDYKLNYALWKVYKHEDYLFTIKVVYREEDDILSVSLYQHDIGYYYETKWDWLDNVIKRFEERKKDYVSKVLKSWRL